MRTIERATAFKKDYNREAKGRHKKTLDADLLGVLTVLADDRALDPSYRDHDLGGVWIGFRECHIKPDLLLIYRKPDTKMLQLARLGSHRELFG
jgi:mRNA interferase YafQ